MAIGTECQTPGVVFHTAIRNRRIRIRLKLPKSLNLTKGTATLLENNLHNAIEMALAPYFLRTTPEEILAKPVSELKNTVAHA